MADEAIDRTGSNNPIRKLYDWVLGWAESPYALVALFVISLAEASFFPIPPDVLLIPICLGAARKGFQYALICSVASVMGGLLGYWIGMAGWAELSGFFFQYIPGFSPDKFEHVKALYVEHGIAIVFTAGFSPIPYKLFTITSGVMDLALGPFLLASAVSRSLRFFIVAGLIYRYGEPICDFIDRYFNILALLFSLLLVGGFVGIKLFL